MPSGNAHSGIGFDGTNSPTKFDGYVDYSIPLNLPTVNIGVAGGALSDTTGLITKAAIADATATAIATITVPNAKHSAVVRATFVGSIGAGGAIGAGEAVHAISYDFIICRTAGVAAVALISTAYGSAKQAVAGATTVTTAGAVSAVSGGVTATNTFTLNISITKADGASAAHVGFVRYELLNSFASGITIA